MATTTLMPLDPEMSPQRIARVLTISADLLPAEIVAARRARRTRNGVLIVLVLVLAALGGWFLLADRDLRQANDELADAGRQTSALQREQAKHSQVVTVKNDTDAISGQLRTLLGSDLPWATLLDTLRTTGTAAGVKVEGVSGTLNSEADKASPTGLPSSTDASTIGKITITGSAGDKPSVARYVDSLGALTTVANPYLTSVTQDKQNGVTFSLSIDITSEALCGRFTTACKTGGN
jgi:Tfp pilus assembly protein PilN